MKPSEETKVLNAPTESKQNESISKNESEKLTEKARFMQIIQTHHNYLIELKQQRSSRLLRDHRAQILNTTQSQLYASYLDKHLTYKEFRSCVDYMRDMLSWENITGVKQLSIFDEYKLNDNE